MSLAEWILSARQSQFKNAKTFWKTSQAPFSYEYYSSVESGRRFPNIDTLLFLCDHLGLNKKKACYMWARECMPDQETKDYFRWEDDVSRQEVTVGSQISLEDTFLVSLAHKELLESDPIYWKVLSLFSIWEDRPHTLKKLQKQLKMPEDKLKAILKKLVASGLLRTERGKYRHPKPYMHIPNDRDFFGIRNMNFLNTSSEVINAMTAEEVVEHRAFRTTVHKLVSHKQVSRTWRHIQNLIGDLLNQEPPVEPEDPDAYALCIAFGRRPFDKSNLES